MAPQRPYFCATAAMAAVSSSYASLLPAALAFASSHVVRHQQPRRQLAHANSHVAANSLTSRSSPVIMLKRHASRSPMSNGLGFRTFNDVDFSDRNGIAKRYAQTQAGDTEASDSISDDTEDLPSKLRQAYEAGDTDGIIDIFDSDDRDCRPKGFFHHQFTVPGDMVHHRGVKQGTFPLFPIKLPGTF